MELSAKQASLLGMLKAIPPDINKISDYLSKQNLTKEDISLVGAMFIDDYERIADDSNPEQVRVIEPQSEYAYIIVKLLLDNGLNPNYIHEDINIMDRLQLIGTPYVAADIMGLLLENGGRTDLEVDGELIFER